MKLFQQIELFGSVWRLLERFNLDEGMQDSLSLYIYIYSYEPTRSKCGADCRDVRGKEWSRDVWFWLVPEAPKPLSFCFQVFGGKRNQYSLAHWYGFYGVQDWRASTTSTVLVYYCWAWAGGIWLSYRWQRNTRSTLALQQKCVGTTIPTWVSGRFFTHGTLYSTRTDIGTGYEILSIIFGLPDANQIPLNVR
jgi:hypothetical protein